MIAVVARKTVNAFIAGAEADMAAIDKAASAVSAAATRRVTERIQKRLGGLWVGGHLSLAEDLLAFVPNAMNQRMHLNDCSWSLALSDIDRVERRFGWLTGLIDVHADGMTRTVRCFGADRFAALIRERVEIARG